MSEEILGGSDLGTAGLEQVVNETVNTEVTPEAPVETQVESSISMAEAMRLKEENQRLKDYNEFIRETSRPQEPSNIPTFDMAGDQIPYVEDVDKLVEAKMYKFQQMQEQKQVERDLASIAEQSRTSDPTFDKRMELAIEYMDRDPVAMNRFNEARTAKDKISVLEKIAKWHPLYDSIQKPAPIINDAISRLQANAALPNTLATMQSAGKTQKAVTEMNEQEYNDLFKQITKGY